MLIAMENRAASAELQCAVPEQGSSRAAVFQESSEDRKDAQNGPVSSGLGSRFQLWLFLFRGFKELVAVEEKNEAVSSGACFLFTNISCSAAWYQ